MKGKKRIQWCQSSVDTFDDFMTPRIHFMALRVTYNILHYLVPMGSLYEPRSFFTICNHAGLGSVPYI